jgi:hypothetical protein
MERSYPWSEPRDDDYYDEREWIDCESCGGTGMTGEHDCGEDTCCCLNPEENVICDICEGAGGWDKSETEGKQP